MNNVCQTQEVKECEMSKAITGLHTVISDLTEKIKVLKERLTCVSNVKPEEVEKATEAPYYPEVIQAVRNAEANVKNLYTLVNNMIEELEI